MSGTRPAYWPELRDFTQTPVYSFEMLLPGNLVQGPAVIDAELTTVVVPPGQSFSIDEYGLGILETTGAAAQGRSKMTPRATARA
jgi:N-methylhydantoinase A/acetophenone carboxylase